ncbi:hypothetical protein MWN33_10850 [Starkeya koreensis]|uniref:Uncharacterized protein n=1 Tax=Ancylobacter koreensis TaxID=266121 RepID=A0ABT0DMM8_9HYPH|nr:hypothetical protein [Ancylobacter koreensis]MCK0208529.1 hypothetical protein [Ancylobacter koreensis]
MNLFDMIRRKDANLVVTSGVEMAKGRVAGELWRGVHLASGNGVRVAGARRFHSLRGQPDHCGWRVSVPEDLQFEIGLRSRRPGRCCRIGGRGRHWDRNRCACPGRGTPRKPATSSSR